MLKPIQREHELICPGCGVVLSEIQEEPINDGSPTTSYSLNVELLGSVLEKNVKYALPKTNQQGREEQVLRLLEHITKKYGLPPRIARETFQQMKKKNRGFWSEKEPIKQLMKILSKDDNYMYINKLRMIKARYESDFTF